MKYLLILALALAVIWLWKAHRRSSSAEKARAQNPHPATGKSKALQTTEVIACDVCAVHLPLNEALTGGRGVYCSEAHRRQAES